MKNLILPILLLSSPIAHSYESNTFKMPDSVCLARAKELSLNAVGSATHDYVRGVSVISFNTQTHYYEIACGDGGFMLVDKFTIQEHIEMENKAKSKEKEEFNKLRTAVGL